MFAVELASSLMITVSGENTVTCLLEDFSCKNRICTLLKNIFSRVNIPTIFVDHRTSSTFFGNHRESSVVFGTLLK